MRTENDKITLGSVLNYIMEFNGALPETSEICKPENLLGKTKGGAQVLYSCTKHEESDDQGTVYEEIITAEEASVKLGLITFNGQTLAKLADRCKVTEDKTKGIRTVKIGGHGNAQNKKWVICCHHEDKKKGDVWVRIVGTNKAGLSLTYGLDAATKLEPEFKCHPADDEGTLIYYDEQIKKTEQAG